MNKDTKERISYYRNYLPKMREKLFGAAMMFLIAALMMGSATFAWLTLSQSPEVMKIDTTVTANGNLEIALAGSDGSAPGPSKEGDSSAAKGSSVVKANLTWGNLVNLTDPSYGLSEIALRPAKLKDSGPDLLTNPLQGVSYGSDGRVENITGRDDFAYTYYDVDKKEFLADLKSEHLGVRAISTVIYQDLQAGNKLKEKYDEAYKAHGRAQSAYNVLTNQNQSPGDKYIASLQGLIQQYAQSVIDGGLDDMDITAHVEDMYNMMKDLDANVMEETGKAYLNMADMLFYQYNGAGVPFTYTVDTLCEKAINKTLESYIDIPSLEQFAKDRQQLKKYILVKKNDAGEWTLTTSEQQNNFAYYADLAASGTTVYWKNLSGAINWLVNIGTCTLDGYDMSTMKSNALKILNTKNHVAIINDGALYRVEHRIGAYMSPQITITVDASKVFALAGKQTFNNVPVTTKAKNEKESKELDADLTYAQSQCGGTVRGTDATALDTYAMAVDFWLRTNAGSRGGEAEITQTEGTDEDGNPLVTEVARSPETAFVTLEGSLKTKTVLVDQTVNDINGNPQPAYKLEAVYNGETVQSETGYLRDGKYYYVDKDSGNEVDATELTAANGIELKTTKLTEEKTEIIGYDGINRVWTESQMENFEGEGTSTTQGGGSCYIFYADTPDDQQRFLKLLGSMRVVFIDEYGNNIGSAVMDTANYFAQNGKVTVPLAVESQSGTYLGTDSAGKDIYGLCELEKAVAKRLTALVYLDGTALSNNMVLASGDIQGSLNLQFSTQNASRIDTTEKSFDADGNLIKTESTVKYELGTSSIAIKNEEVMDDFITVSADATVKSFEYDPDVPAQTTVNVKVGGVEPGSVSANFIRAVNSTQGSLQPTFTLTGSGENWTANYTFKNPGTYILRTVWIDGAEYDLTSPITVQVNGIAVNSLFCDALTDDRYAEIFTASTTFSTKLEMDFARDKGTPESVNCIFLDEAGNRVNAILNKDKSGTVWSGNAVFTSSGKYTLQYYEIDGLLYELPEAMRAELNMQLGLKVRTWIKNLDNPEAVATNFKIEPNQTVTLRVEAEIYDNNGNSIPALSDTKLTYSRSGSSVDKLDSDMIWNPGIGRYVGDFNVEKAGAYRFAYMEVGENSISGYTNAPSIYAMPPENVSYYNNVTDEYQYAPEKDAFMLLGLAYSNAATKVEASITNGDTSETVVGTVENEYTSDDGKTVSVWKFPVPQTADGSQEGEWILRNVTLYGVYYNGTLYEEGGTGARIDLVGENIKTKVVNTINVTFSSRAENFTGYFMDAHSVSGATVTISDYAGSPIQGVEISNVAVEYKLNLTKTGLDQYGYEGDYSAANVSANASLRSGSTTVYDVPTLNFRYAGEYSSCEITFNVNGKPFTAGQDNTRLRYKTGETATDNCPVIDVKWTAPTAKITAVSPASGTTFSINTGSRSTTTRVTGHNFLSPDGFYARLSGKTQSSSAYSAPTWSSATVAFSDGGSNFTKASIKLVNGDFSTEYSFTPNGTSQSKEIGSGGSLSSAHARAGYQKFETIDMVYGGKTFQVKLSHTLEIYGQDNRIPQFTYSAGDYSSNGVVVPSGVTEFPYYTQSQNEIILGTVDDAHKTLINTYEEAGDLDTSRTQKNESSFTAYYEGTEGSGCNKKTVYYPYTVTTVVEKTPATKNVYNAAYNFAGWTISSTNHTTGAVAQYGSGRTYTAGTKLTFGTNAGVDYLANPVYSVGEKQFVSSAEQNYVVTTVTVTAGTQTETKPNGTSYSNAAAITNLAGTTEGWE